MSRSNSDEHEIEYDMRLAVLRISFFIIILLMISLTMYKYFYEDEINADYFSTVEDIAFVNEPVEKNSQGDFISVDDSIKIEGSLELDLRENKTYVVFENFKITYKPDIKLALSTKTYQKQMVILEERIKGTIGTQEYELPDKVNINIHKYLLFIDKESNKVIAYSTLI